DEKESNARHRANQGSPENLLLHRAVAAERIRSATGSSRRGRLTCLRARWLAPVHCTAWFDEPDIPSNALKTWRLQQVWIYEKYEVRVEVTVVDSDGDAIRLRRLILENVSEIRNAREALEASVTCHVKGGVISAAGKPHEQCAGFAKDIGLATRLCNCLMHLLYVCLLRNGRRRAAAQQHYAGDD